AADGEKPIEDIQVGDKVLSKDEKTGKREYKKVTQLFKREVDQIYTVTVGKEKIETTAEHPFWVKDKGWVPVKNLQEGDLLEDENGKALPVEKISIKNEKTTVYNFEVEDYHTYYVSDTGIWVHNKCGVDLYRAVGAGEYHDIMKTGQFRSGRNSLEGKQFGKNLDETLKFADFATDTVAIMKVTIPQKVFKQLDHTHVDPFIFKSGTATVHQDMYKTFNNSFVKIEHAY
ncbi:hypothetical protein J2Z48_003209, partial [Croceifilum oryzae]